MYHGIGASGEGPTRFVVPAARFERQMMWLKRRRYNVMSLDEYLRCRAEYRLPPPKTVVVTLDDGYLDNITIGRPILERLGVPATIFVVSGVDRNTWSTSEDVAGRPLMSLDDTQRALGGVITFGAHSRTHPKLPEVSPPEAEREVGGSKEDLEAGLGVPITTFAYPYGRVNDDVREIVVAAGFACACGVVPGRNRPAADNYLLRRMEVFGTDRLPRFALIVWLGEIGMKWRRRT
jgi:peptidoglycan/xylan/chitin deacetylase (PgdA/CDA1 family)